MEKMMKTVAITNHSHNSIYVSYVYLFCSLYYLSFFSDTMELISSAVALLIAMVVIR